MAPHESLVQRYRGKLSQFDKLQSTLERASQQRERQKREDQSRLQRLPVHERIAVQRQARALQRWERAQRYASSRVKSTATVCSVGSH